MSPSRSLTIAVRMVTLLSILVSLLLPQAALAAAPDNPSDVVFAWSATLGAQPPPGFADPTGIDVGPDGNVYISDATRNDIQVFTPTGAFVRKFGAAGSAGTEFREAADVAAVGDKVYVADRNNARVQVLTPQGEFLALVDGRQPVSGASNARLPWRVDADAMGRIFLLNYGDSALYRYSPAGVLERRHDEPCVVGPYQGLAVLPSGVAFCSAINGGVWKLPLTGAGTNIGGGAGQGQGWGPVAQLAAAPDNSLWAYRIDSVSSAPAQPFALIHFAADGTILGQYEAGSGIIDIAASADHVYALTTGRRVRVYDWQGQVVGEWGADAFAATTAFERPDRVVAAPDGTFYALESGRKRLRHLSASGEVLAQLALGERQGNLSAPVDMAVDGLGRLYVLDQSYITRVVRYAQDQFDAVIPIPASQPSMNDPRTIAVTGDTLMVSQGSAILRFDLSGRRIGQTQAQMPQYSSYVEAALAGPNRLFRLYTGDPAVIAYDLLGKQLVSWGDNLSAGDGQVGPGVFVYPTDIAADLRGQIFVLDTEQTPFMASPARSSRVQVFDESGTYLTAFGSYGNAAGQFILPQSVAALADGRVVVADTGNNRLQIFAPQGALPAIQSLPAPEQWNGGGPLRSAFWREWGTQGIGGFRDVIIPPQPSVARPILGFYDSGLATSLDGKRWNPVPSVRLPGGTYQYAGASTLIATGGVYDAPYRSADLGRTWMRMSDKVPTGPTFIAPSPTFDADRTLFLAAYEGGVWRSTDAGDTWELRGGADQEYYDLVALPGQGGGRVLLALAGKDPVGIHRSTDDGATWQVVDAESGTDLIVSPTVSQDHTVFATGAYYSLNGVKRSTDGGLTWQQVGAETGQHWRNLALSPTYATDHSVMVWDSAMSYLSKNGGDTWTLLKPAASPYLRWLAFAPTYASDGGIWRQAFDVPTGIEATNDGGATWRPLGDAPATPALSLASLPAPDKAPWAAVAYGVVTWPSGPASPTFLYRFPHGRGSAHINLALSPAFDTDGTAIAESVITKDKGATWQPLPFASEIAWAAGAVGSSQAAAFSPSYTADGVALVGYDEWPSQPVSDAQRTADHGATWQSGAIPVGSVRAIVFDTGNSQRVYAGGEGGLAVSADGGMTWQIAGGPLAFLSVRSLAARQENGVAVVYAATTSAGMWRSADGGASWTKFNAGLGDGYLCAVAGNAHLLAAATCAGQVYLLGADNVWARAGAPLPGVVNDMVVQGAADAGRITVGTSVGVWSAALPLGEAQKTWLPVIRR